MTGHKRNHEWLETFEGAGADRYDGHARWLHGMHRRTADRVAALLPAGGRLLDVGCGPGVLLAEVVARRPDVHVTGVDLSERMVELATARLATVEGGPALDDHVAAHQDAARPDAAAAPRADAVRALVLRGDAASLPVADSSADVVTAVLTTHHWEDLKRGFDEVARVLAPGGAVLVVEMRGPARHVAGALRDALGSSDVNRRAVWTAGLPLLVGLEARRPAAA